MKGISDKTCTVLVQTSTDPQNNFREPRRTVLCYIAWNGKLHLKYWNVKKDIWIPWSHPLNMGGAKNPVLINVEKYLYVIGGFDALAGKYIKAVGTHSLHIFDPANFVILYFICDFFRLRKWTFWT